MTGDGRIHRISYRPTKQCSAEDIAVAMQKEYRQLYGEHSGGKTHSATARNLVTDSKCHLQNLDLGVEISVLIRFQHNALQRKFSVCFVTR
jgi:hypothetical protein